MMHACPAPTAFVPGPVIPQPGSCFVPTTRQPTWGDAFGPLHTGTAGHVVAAVDPDDEEEDIGDEEDLAVAQPTADDESSFDDFDDEFDDDFEEEENDPDWDHPDDGDAEPPPGKAPGRKK